jgi:hypothetical protein
MAPLIRQTHVLDGCETTTPYPVVADAWRRRTVASALARADTDHMRVNGTRDAVKQLDVKLGEDVF